MANRPPRTINVNMMVVIQRLCAMTTNTAGSTTTQQTRRRYLQALSVGATGAAAGLAGCLGDDEPDEVELRFSGCHPEAGTNMGQFQVLFKEIVEENSDGEITIDNFFEGELGGTLEVMESVQEGTVDMNACHHYPGGADLFGIPELAFLSSPFIFEDYSDALVATDPENSDFAQEMYDRQLEEANTRVLASFAFGTRCFSMVEDRVTSPEEVGGARIRGPEGDLMEAVIRGLGGEPVLIDWGETPQALATGLADGIEQILWALELEPIVENTEYLILTRHMSEVIGCTINEDTFQGLSETHQEILQESAIEARDEHLPGALERDQGRVDRIEDAGLEVIDEDAGLQLDQFRESVFGEMESQFPDWEDARERLTAAL